MAGRARRRARSKIWDKAHHSGNPISGIKGNSINGCWEISKKCTNIDVLSRHNIAIESELFGYIHAGINKQAPDFNYEHDLLNKMQKLAKGYS